MTTTDTTTRGATRTGSRIPVTVLVDDAGGNPTIQRVTPASSTTSARTSDSTTTRSALATSSG